MTKNIAIIGTGISGLTCAYLLNKQHKVTVFECNDYIGGHTRTVDVEVAGRQYAVDTGFIVFNDWTYPNFLKLMAKLEVQQQPTEMSFSVKNTAQNLEYNGNTINTLFAQRRNIVRPKFLRIVRDIVKFNKVCKQEHASATFPEDATLGDLLAQYRLSDDFAQNYILPMCAAIWSASLESIKTFPLKFFLQFFMNHGLLNITNRPQWYTLIGGSSSYIKPLTKEFKDSLFLNSGVTSVEKVENGYQVTSLNTALNGHYDEVIFACHSDQALKMLKNPTPQQAAVLGAIPYANNEVVLHTDTNLLPKRPLAWASWNYLLDGKPGSETAPATLTYDMNILQRIQSDTTFCVTLNATDKIAPDKILRTFNYSHPQFSQQTIEAQQQRETICGIDGMHFCGAYWYNGFHEDGVRSALDVCKRFGEELL